MKNLLLSVICTLVALSGCKNNSDAINQKPILSITHQINGLIVTLKGSALDVDGIIADVSINWGNNNTSKVAKNVYPNFEASRTYSSPGTYNIKIAAIDNEGDTTIQIIPVTLDYKETSLAGIRETMFKTSENEFLILTVNLHTYQELQQNEKFHLVADVIGKMDIDFVAFQECAQHKSTAISSGIIRTDNMALIISKQLKEGYNTDYNFVWNWAHYGWDVWEEGVSVLSKYPILRSEDRFISATASRTSIASRKAIYGSYQTPKGNINIISAHTYWRTSVTDEEQNNQIKNIKALVTEKESPTTDIATFVCGDFNGNPTSDYPWSEGYTTMMANNEYLDTFLEVNPNANTKPAQSDYYTIFGDMPGRIDYIFMKKNTHFKVIDSQIIFKSDIVGKISDHYGVITKVSYTE